ncbi:hypothetical protein M513_06448 [Trichuris suis]|uniref:DDE-1 domain-containing protein n=1 Tax=Trichuris suis TaxID=68888 RepID=A0A085M5V5_9BILA|nr:hypothetical protein M513_06448 [Trichuris suis]
MRPPRKSCVVHLMKFQLNLWKFLKKFPYLARGLKDDHVFNADECRLFLKAIPGRRFVMKSDKCKNRKLSKERFTVLLCAISTGKKLKLLVIDKSVMPSAFKKLKPEDHPIICISKKFAWMTGALFEDWVGISTDK